MHVLPLQEFAADAPYDFIISGLPLNNFSPNMVREVFESYFKLLAPGGTLSYFEYMYVRSLRKRIGRRDEKQRMRSLDEIITPYLSQHRVRRSWVFVNLPARLGPALEDPLKACLESTDEIMGPTALARHFLSRNPRMRFVPLMLLVAVSVVFTNRIERGGLADVSARQHPPGVYAGEDCGAVEIGLGL